MPGAHNVNVRILEPYGKTRNVWRDVSGNATEAEMALGTGKMRQATHTEQRALTRIDFVDETMIITGQNAPCKKCQGAMRKATMNNSATIRYQWREDGKTLYEVWQGGKKLKGDR